MQLLLIYHLLQQVNCELKCTIVNEFEKKKRMSMKFYGIRAENKN